MMSLPCRLAYLESSGQSGKPYYKVAKMATEMNGYYSLGKSFGLPEEALEVRLF